MKKYITIFLFLKLLILSLSAQNPFIKNYSIAEGLHTNKVNCVYKDSKGFMWFGTDAGAFRFDGKNIVNFTTEDGLSDNFVVRIKEDFNGRLWFMNYNGTTNFLFENEIFNENNAPFLSDLKTNSFLYNFFQDKDSTLYFYNNASEIFATKNNQLIDYINHGGTSYQNEINFFYLNKSSEDNFYLWDLNGIYEFEEIDDSLIFHPHSEKLHKAFFKTENESIGLDRNGNLHIFKDNKIIQENILHSETHQINSILIDHDNYIWLATFDKGVFCYKNEELILHLDIANAQTLVLDDENNIWTSSIKKGVFKVNRDILKYNFNGKEKFDNEGITDLALENSGGIWLTNGSSMFVLHNNKIQTTSLKVNNDIITNLHQLRNNTLLANGSETELYVFDNIEGNIKSYSKPANNYKSLRYRIKKTAIGRDEQYLYSYFNDELVLINFTKNDLYSLTTAKIRRGRINNVFFNRYDKLIVNSATNDMITINPDYTGEKGIGFYISNVLSLKPIEGQSITSHIVINDKYELFNLVGNNLLLQDSLNFFNLTEEFQNQIDYTIKDIAYHGSTLFFFTTKTIYFISNPLKIINGEALELNRLNIDFNHINDVLCKDSTLYVASDNGLTFIPIEDCVNAQIQATKPYFANVSLDEEEFDFSKGIIEFKNKNRLSIDFSSFNFSSIPSNYSYMLEGADNNWISGNENRVVYLNLKPGNYLFKLKSRKEKENYSEIIELPIIVHPTIFQRLISKVVLALLLFGIVFLLIRYFYQRKIKQKETDTLLITLEHKALQSMMNPHFIFNALGSIQRYLLENKSAEAGTYLSKFARLIRQNMNSLKANSISIEDEVERLRNYIDLERFRMNNKFEYSIEVDSNINDYDSCIPSMIVQPFVENSIWHGVSSLEEHKGEITIRFKEIDEKSILIEIGDNGMGIEKSKVFSKSEHNLNMGVSLTIKRLKLIGERKNVNSKITTSELNPGEINPGTKISLVVPLV